MNRFCAVGASSICDVELRERVVRLLDGMVLNVARVECWFFVRKGCCFGVVRVVTKKGGKECHTRRVGTGSWEVEPRDNPYESCDDKAFSKAADGGINQT